MSSTGGWWLGCNQNLASSDAFSPVLSSSTPQTGYSKHSASSRAQGLGGVRCVQIDRRAQPRAPELLVPRRPCVKRVPFPTPCAPKTLALSSLNEEGIISWVTSIILERLPRSIGRRSPSGRRRRMPIRSTNFDRTGACCRVQRGPAAAASFHAHRTEVGRKLHDADRAYEGR